jgi:environmental stress-induced protein Ves
MHRVLTPADYHHTTWKNGGGRTTEIAAFPADAGLDRFAWRVSIADIGRSGPFSAFAGVDRTLVLLQGPGLVLTGVGEPLEVRAHYEPIEFAGDISLECTLTGGPVRDFNLMIRRSRARGELAIVRGSAEAIAPAQFQLCYAAVGVCECLLAGHVPLTLHDGNTLLVESFDAAPSVLHVNPLSSDAVAVAAAIDLIGDAH